MPDDSDSNKALLEYYSAREDILRKRLLTQGIGVSYLLETGKSFLEANPHLLISILYLDFDLYEPTKLALELFFPRVLKGGLIFFDELNHPAWPGETLAILEKLNLKDYNIRKFPLFPEASYLVV